MRNPPTIQDMRATVNTLQAMIDGGYFAACDKRHAEEIIAVLQCEVEEAEDASEDPMGTGPEPKVWP